MSVLSRGSAGAFFFRIALPLLRMLSLRASAVSPWVSTRLLRFETILRSRDITSLVLCGISTSGVVLSTVRWAADMDYDLVVVEDCCADGDDEVHRVLTRKVFPRQARVVSASEIIEDLT